MSKKGSKPTKSNQCLDDQESKFIKSLLEQILNELRLLKFKISGICENQSIQKEIQSKRKIDLFDLQLFLAVIVIFVSAWAYLNTCICNFTESVSLNLQMSYIWVHYILTIFIFLCIYISFIKGQYIIERDRDISENNLKLFRLFLDSWFITLVFSFLILVSTRFVSWWIWVIMFLVVLGVKLKKLEFEKFKCFIMMIYVVSCFPLYISIMTSMMKEVNIETDKPYYNLEDDILITINVRGYSCEHRLVGLGDKELFSNSNYQIAKNMIVLPASVVKMNSISVGVELPVSGKMFFLYPFFKMFGKDYSQYWDDLSENKRSVFYNKAYINIKP